MKHRQQQKNLHPQNRNHLIVKKKIQQQSPLLYQQQPQQRQQQQQPQQLKYRRNLSLLISFFRVRLPISLQRFSRFRLPLERSVRSHRRTPMIYRHHRIVRQRRSRLLKQQLHRVKHD